MNEILEATAEQIRILSGSLALADGTPKANEDHAIVVLGERAVGSHAFNLQDGSSETISITDRHVLLIPAAQVYSLRVTVNPTLTAIMLTPSLFDDMAQGEGVNTRGIVEHSAAADPFLWHLIRGVSRLMAKNVHLDRSYIESIGTVVGHHILENYIDTPLNNSKWTGLPKHKLKRAIEFVKSQCHTDIGFRDIARELDISPFHFSRMFKQSMGVSL